MHTNLMFNAAAKCIGPDIIPIKYFVLDITSIVSLSERPV